MADQICYAVLCVFSYFAAGQEQKKQILEQVTKLPIPQIPPPASVETQSLPSTKSINAPENPFISPTRPKAVKSPTPIAKTVRTENEQIDTQERTSPREKVFPNRGSFKNGVNSTSKINSGTIPQRADSLPSRTMSVRGEPPRRPPPPRMHSQAVDLPTLPPRPSASRPLGPPPALPPRQMSAAAEFTSSVRSPHHSQVSSPIRRLPQRQGSISSPFATNPFATAQRQQTEFVIPHRNNSRRSSTSDQ